MQAGHAAADQLAGSTIDMPACCCKKLPVLLFESLVTVHLQNAEMHVGGFCKPEAILICLPCPHQVSRWLSCQVELPVSSSHLSGRICGHLVLLPTRCDNGSMLGRKHECVQARVCDSYQRMWWPCLRTAMRQYSSTDTSMTTLVVVSANTETGNGLAERLCCLQVDPIFSQPENDQSSPKVQGMAMDTTGVLIRR